MLKKILYFVAGAAILFNSAIFAEIIETSEIATVQNYVTEDSLVLMNITGTLYAPGTALADNQWRMFFEKRVKELVKDEAVAERMINTIKNEIVKKLPKKPVEETTAQFVAQLQSRKIPVLGITRKQMKTAYANNFDVITSKHLLSVGIDLGKTLSYLTVQGNDDENQALAHGIIFTNKKMLGPSLLAFLNRLETKPAKIILVDDAEKNLKSAEEALQGHEIVFEGFRYSRSDKQNADFDPVLGTIEFFAFIADGSTMTDEEASQLKERTANIDYTALLDQYIILEAYYGYRS